MRGYEQLGYFYLGRHFELATRTRTAEPVLYDSRHLVTHAVCVGMTGSGKTGLGLTLIEEAAIDGVPVLAIDPKGDLGNLLLTFPELSGDAFVPWVDPSEAARKGMSIEAFAATQADRWKSGLEEWDEDGERVARLRAAARAAIFTPGSRAGVPLAMYSSLNGSASGGEAGAAAAGTAASLLGLVGMSDAEPHSREAVLLSMILSSEDAPANADLGWLVQQIQRPGFTTVGVLDLETFFPAKDRQALALRFNGVLAAPSFKVWLEGAPLDIDKLLYTPDGKPRVAIVSIAHLDDAERMMVVSRLLNAVLEWTRRQSGTASLRAMVYMDEVFGYLPPVANPPSKLPLLTLLKQARAFGVGLVLATQNPVDLDYKALSNTGTWLLGKLQTDRDKQRVLEGLESVSGVLDRATLDRMLTSLQSRVFLMHNVHQPQPIVFETRWTLSYLRGPLTREGITRLTAASQAAAPQTPSTPAPPSPSAPSPTSSPTSSPAPPSPTEASGAVAGVPPIPRFPTASAASPATTSRPIMAAGIQDYFMPPASTPAAWSPAMYGAARVHYVDTKRGIDAMVDVHATTPFASGAVPLDWTAAELTDVTPEDLDPSAAAPGDTFGALPPAAVDPKRYPAWGKAFEQWVLRQRPLCLFEAPALKLTSSPGETERDFRVRVQLALRETRDARVEALRAKYAARLERATSKVRKAEDTVGREEQQVSQQQTQTAVSFGATVLGALMGRSPFSMSTLGRATTVARNASRSMKEREDVGRALAKVAEARAELVALQGEIDAAVKALETGPDDLAIIPLEVKPKRGAVETRIVCFAWKP